MRIELVEAPAVEPVTLADCYLQSRQDNTTYDASIANDYRIAAREKTEAFSHRRLITQTIDVFLDSWNERGLYIGPLVTTGGGFGSSLTQTGSTLFNQYQFSHIVFPVSPVQSIVFLRYYDSGGHLQTSEAGGTVDLSQFTDGTGSPGRFGPKQNCYFPPTATQIDAIQFRLVVGYGDDGTAVPATAKNCIRTLFAHMYDAGRSATTDVPLTETPLGFQSGIRQLSLGQDLFP